MSVRNAMLALLQSGPKYGYQLKTEFEATTGGVWPLNIGQVYQTLSRLERDGLVEPAGSTQEGHQTYRITTAGRDEVAGWFTEPVDRSTPARDELAVKVMLALCGLADDVGKVLQRQRNAAIRTLQEYTRLKAQADNSADLAWLMVLDSMILKAEAEVRWLDLADARIRRADLGTASVSGAPETGNVARPELVEERTNR